MTTRDQERRLENLSPFELKNSLIELADEHHHTTAATMLNAGRGNPNWVATTPREAFWLLGRFGVTESRRDWNEFDGIGGMPAKPGIATRFAAFLEEHRGEPGAELLRAAVEYGVTELGFEADPWVWELTDGVIGDHYPEPDRMLRHLEQVVQRYLVKEMYAGTPPARGFDLFATEGGTAAMCYIFDTLVTNRLLHPGDTIALMTPIFTPYLEIPQLERYRFRVLEIEARKLDRQGLHTWQYDDAEIDKLSDPSVKALFLVNPSNPPSVMLAPATMARIKAITQTANPGLTIITDDVYGTFVNGFESLMSTVPRNTIGVYSYSKYFGCTGWRLGVVVVNRDNIFDQRLAELPAADKQALDQRYGTLTLEPGKLRFVDRLVADSRQVALNHTAGLSLPQQVQMALFSMSALLDTQDSYKRACQAIIQRRLDALVRGMGVPLPDNPLAAHYYVELDLMRWIELNLSPEFAAWMKQNHEPVDPIFRLAEKGSVVLLNGGGFEGPQWSVRVSLANLRMDAYEQIGAWLREIMQGYYQEFQAATGTKAGV